METLVRLSHRDTLIETTKLGDSLYILHHNIIYLEEEEPNYFIYVYREIMAEETINKIVEK